MLRASSSFEEYWSSFVKAHLNVVTRRVQFVATSLGVASLFAGIVWRRGALVVLAPAMAWLPTWLAQRAFEEAAPPPPVPVAFAVAANLRMWRMTFDGTMDAEVERVATAEGPSPVPPGTPEPNMVTDHMLH
jgi:hypothetical protein